MLASALFDLIPESIHQVEILNANGAQIDEMMPFVFIILGFVIFFILERFIYWFHGHTHEKEDNRYVFHGDLLVTIPITKNASRTVKNFVILNLVGDSLHNFLDGIIIMVSFLNGLENGIIISLAVIIHEIPQEIGDFGILLYGGLTKKQALFLNFITAMVSLLGGIFTLLISNLLASFNLFFLAFSGGGFLYIACVELMPETFKEANLKKSIFQTILFFLGILLIYILITNLPHV